MTYRELATYVQKEYSEAGMKLSVAAGSPAKEALDPETELTITQVTVNPQSDNTPIDVAQFVAAAEVWLSENPERLQE